MLEKHQFLAYDSSLKKIFIRDICLPTFIIIYLIGNCFLVLQKLFDKIIFIASIVEINMFNYSFFVEMKTFIL